MFFWYSSLAMGASYILESGNFYREAPLTDADFGLPKTHYLLHMQTLTFRLILNLVEKVILDQDMATSWASFTDARQWLEAIESIAPRAVWTSHCHPGPIYRRPILLRIVLEEAPLESPNTPKMLFQTCAGSWLASMPDQMPLFL